jgi:hypothetical protein
VQYKLPLGQLKVLRRIDYALAPLREPEILIQALFNRQRLDLIPGVEAPALLAIANEMEKYYLAEVKADRVRGFPFDETRL